MRLADVIKKNAEAHRQTVEQIQQQELKESKELLQYIQIKATADFVDRKETISLIKISDHNVSIFRRHTINEIQPWLKEHGLYLEIRYDGNYRDPTSHAILIGAK